MRSILPRVGLSVLVACHKATVSTAFSASNHFETSIENRKGSKKSIMMATSTEDIERTKSTIRVLALHGSEGDAQEFPLRLKPLEESLEEKHGVKLEITAVQAPFVKGSGYSWWTMLPGVRSFTADSYEGFETSASLVSDAMNSERPPFDLVLGHSQGAILMASLIALGKTPYNPKNGYILNGCGFCNPFAAEVESLNVSEQDPRPRCLFIIGVNDMVTPSDIQEKLRDGFQSAGLGVSTIQHPKGHGFPKDKDHFMELIMEFILKGSS